MKTTWRWHVLSDGWTEAPEAVAIAGGSWRKKVRFSSAAVLLEHERHGCVLFDTGYSPRFFQETARWPCRVYRQVTPVTLTEPRGILGVLERRGVNAGMVRHIIVSHWHADHVGGLRDFSQAQLHTCQEAWDSIQGLSRFAALRQAVLPGLIPEDAARRLRWVSEGTDVFGDGSLTVLELPGHAAGQIGVRFLAEDGRPVLLAADACWLSAAYRGNRLPHPVTRLLHDWPAYRRSLARLHRLHLAEPELRIIPSHCPEIHPAGSRLRGDS